MSGIEARFHIAFPGFTLDVRLDLPGRGVSALFGPSGCGKTTCLRAMAGLERAPGAVLRVNGETWQDEPLGLFVPVHRRALGYVFQDANLFPHLSVRGNVEYGMKRVAPAQRRVALDQAVQLLGIAPLMDRKPATLSGGERQRVAIARALAASPRLLLMDEPLAALDAPRKAEVLPYLEKLHHELEMPVVYVSHAMDEVARLADTLVLLEGGRVRACGPLAQTLAQAGAAGLLGEDAGALFQGRVQERDARWHLARVAFEGGSLWLRDAGLAVGAPARVRVLARDVSLATREPAGSSIQNVLACTVESVAPDVHPSQVIVRLGCGPGTGLLARITARAADALALQPGQRVWAQVKSAALLE